jgi:HPt (histidine-containing phosphotransfer) domain-containing protein
LAQIRTAISNGDTVGSARLAHSAAGASATCGMVGMVPLLRRLEHLGQDGKLAPAPLLGDVDREFERLKTYLQTHKPIALAG